MCPRTPGRCHPVMLRATQSRITMNAIINLTDSQRAIAGELLSGLQPGAVIVLHGAAGSGKTSVLRSIHAARRGALLSGGEFMRGSAGDERFLGALERAILEHEIVLVDDLHLIADAVDRERAYLWDAAIGIALTDARVLRRALIFSAEGDAPWPVRRRADFCVTLAGRAISASWQSSF